MQICGLPHRQLGQIKKRGWRINLCKALKGEPIPEEVLKCRAEFSRGGDRVKPTASISQTQRDSEAKLKDNIQTYMKQLSMTDVNF